MTTSRLRAILAVLLLAAGLLLLIPSILIAQVDTAWVRRYDGPIHQDDAATCVAIDSAGNIYVGGVSDHNPSPDTGDMDIVAIKYHPNGDTTWTTRYAAYGYPYKRMAGLVVDHSGNVYIGGSRGLTDETDCLVLKYDSMGVLQWQRTYGGGPANGIAAIALDSTDNVVVTAFVQRTFGFNFVTTKYRPNGDTAWVREYEGPTIDLDYPQAIAVDRDNNVIVAGYGAGVGTHYDAEVIKYDSSGTFKWDARYDGPQHGDDRAFAMTLDTAGNVYIAGRTDTGYGTGPDMLTAKFTASGQPAWAQRYAGTANDWDEALAVAVDGSGNVYSAGYLCMLTSFCFATLSYDPTGELNWPAFYDGPVATDQACAVGVRDGAWVAVSGRSDGVGTSYDIATVWYNLEGETLAVRRYNGPGNYFDEPAALVVAATGDVIVVGRSGQGDFLTDMVTVKHTAQSAVSAATLPHSVQAIVVRPNPSREHTKVMVGVPAQAVRMCVVDMTGRSVADLRPYRDPAGRWCADWDGTGSSGNRVSSGVYVIQIDAGGQTECAGVVKCR